jgi:hypothetical protein
MIKKILFVLLFLSATIEAGYVIHLGLYKNRPALQKMVNRIAKTELRSNVTIEKRGSLHWAHSRTIEDNVSAKQALRHYRKVFKDAFMSKAKVKQKKAHASHPVITDQTRSRNTHVIGTKKRSLETQLTGNVFYVSLETAERELLIVAFDGKHVEYNPIMGDIPSFKERYDVIDDRLYTFKEKASGDSVYSTLEKVKKKYLLISSWHQKEKVNTFRYYYELEDALAYVRGG